MAIVYEDALKRSIIGNKFSPVYVLFGDDGFLKQNYVSRLTKKIVDTDDFFNYGKFTQECDLQEVYDFITQLPVMAPKKCAILCDYDITHCSKTDLDKLYSLCGEATEDCILIILFDSFETDYKKDNKFLKLISSVEKNGGMAVQLNHRRVPELEKMLRDGAAKRGCKLDNSVSKYMVEVIGQDINTLKNELEKLCFFAEGKNITKDDIDTACIKTTEASVFALSDQIIQCNINNAIKILDDLFYLRTEPIIILYVISSCYVDMFRVYTFKNSGKNNADVVKEFNYGSKSFLVDKAAVALKKINLLKIDMSFDAILEADRKLKSFNSDSKTVLEQLIIKLIYIITKGEVID